jgi:hypothetical protein
MSEPLIRVKLEKAEYAPGEELAGAFVVEAGEPAELRTLELTVLWYTEGKGDEDLGVIHHEDWAPGKGKDFDLAQPYAFAVRLPRTPLSYDGVIVKVHWCARVRARWTEGEESLTEEPFRLGNVPMALEARA